MIRGGASRQIRFMKKGNKKRCELDSDEEDDHDAPPIRVVPMRGVVCQIREVSSVRSDYCTITTLILHLVAILLACGVILRVKMRHARLPVGLSFLYIWPMRSNITTLAISTS